MWIRSKFYTNFGLKNAKRIRKIENEIWTLTMTIGFFGMICAPNPLMSKFHVISSFWSALCIIERITFKIIWCTILWFGVIIETNWLFLLDKGVFWSEISNIFFPILFSLGRVFEKYHLILLIKFLLSVFISKKCKCKKLFSWLDCSKGLKP